MDDKTIIAVLENKFDNMECLMKKNHRENKEEHKDIVGRQNYMDGNVTRLDKWKISATASVKTAMAILGAITLIVPFIYYLILDNLKYEISQDITSAIEESQKKTDKSITSLKIEMHSIAKDEVDAFAKRNFEEYK